MDTLKTKPTAFDIILLQSSKYIVLTDGMAIGTFKTPHQALSWAYEHVTHGIFSIKELINPLMEI